MERDRILFPAAKSAGGNHDVNKMPKQTVGCEPKGRVPFLFLFLCTALCLLLTCLPVFAEEVPAGQEGSLSSPAIDLSGNTLLAAGALPAPSGEGYSVGWDLNADGVADIVQYYAPGDLPFAPQNGQRSSTPQYRYQFIGWSPELQPVSGPIVYTAQFDQLPQTYRIRCDTDGDGVIDYSELLPYGTIPPVTGAVRPSTAYYDFEFIGWSSEPVSVHEDAVYMAQYRCTPLTDKSRDEYSVSLTVMNTTGEDQSLIIRLLDGNVCVGAIPLDLPNGFNESVSFTGLRKNCYALEICSALEDNRYFHTQTLHLTETATTLSMLLSGKGTDMQVRLDPSSDAVSLSLPRSLLRNETGDRSFTLEASVVKFSSEEVPYRETLELLAGDKMIGMYLQLLLERKSGEETEVTAWISETMTLALRIPEALREAISGDDLSQVTFCRVWDGRSDVISNVPNIYGEFFEYSDGLMLLHVRGSGYYALSYERVRPAVSLWWLMMLCDLVMLVLIWVEHRHHFMEYYLKIVLSLIVTGIVVLVLAIHSSPTAIVFASIGWFIIVWLLIGKTPEQAAAQHAAQQQSHEGLFDAFSGNGNGNGTTWQSWGQGNSDSLRSSGNDDGDSRGKYLDDPDKDDR